jgi:hypothetical protein
MIKEIESHCLIRSIELTYPAIKRARPDRLFWSVWLSLVCLVSLAEQDSRVDRASVMLKPPA